MNSQRPRLRLVSGEPYVDHVVRRQRFEAAHPDVTILPPPGLYHRWRAVVPLGRAPEGSAGTIGAEDLEELMDQLDEIYPPPGDGNPDPVPA